ncbi:putative uncharacterized protein DDB_G0282133 [Daktulosphaira vitifoliae]|uniref:putative uncharacterized protein DDB_G0282133 n=1 Tax=Daktulosphaira vitifoliae TaxID=58002 RepID=UPI0021A9CF0A|nr:putative uncharacterized protein DDB_G0282133 [Daktulosphaira vitifoliae]
MATVTSHYLQSCNLSQTRFNYERKFLLNLVLLITLKNQELPEKRKPIETICETVHQNIRSEVNDSDEPCSSSITPDNKVPINKLNLLHERLKNMTDIYETLNRLKPKKIYDPFVSDKTLHQDTTSEKNKRIGKTNTSLNSPVDMKNDELNALSNNIESMKNCFVQLAEAISKVALDQNELKLKLANVYAETYKQTRENFEITSVTQSCKNIAEPEIVVTKSQSITTVSKTKFENNTTVKQIRKEEIAPKNSSKIKTTSTKKLSINDIRKKKLTSSKDSMRSKASKPSKKIQNMNGESLTSKQKLLEKHTSTTGLNGKHLDNPFKNILEEGSYTDMTDEVLFSNLDKILKSMKTPNNTVENSIESNIFNLDSSAGFNSKSKSLLNKMSRELSNSNNSKEIIEEIPKKDLVPGCDRICQQLNLKSLYPKQFEEEKNKNNLSNTTIDKSIVNEEKWLSFNEICDIILRNNNKVDKFNQHEFINEPKQEKKLNTGQIDEMYIKSECHDNLNNHMLETNVSDKPNGSQNKQNMKLEQCCSKEIKIEEKNDANMNLDEKLNLSCNQNAICSFLKSQPIPEWSKISIYSRKNELEMSCKNDENYEFLPSKIVPQRTKSSGCLKWVTSENTLKNKAEKKQETSSRSCKNNEICQYLKSQPEPDWTKSTNEKHNINKIFKCNNDGICQFLKSQPEPEWTKNSKLFQENNNIEIVENHKPSSKSPLKNNDICQFLDSQPQPEWTSKCPNKSNLNLKYEIKKEEKTSCTKCNSSICDFIQTRLETKSTLMSVNIIEPKKTNCPINIDKQSKEMKSESDSYCDENNISENTKTSFNSYNANNSFSGNRIDKIATDNSVNFDCKKHNENGQYDLSVMDKNNCDFLSSSLGNKQESMCVLQSTTNDTSKRFNNEVCNKKCPIIDSTLINNINVDSILIKNNQEDEEIKSGKKCFCPQKTTNPIIDAKKDSTKYPKEDQNTKILSPCGPCIGKYESEIMQKSFTQCQLNTQNEKKDHCDIMEPNNELKEKKTMNALEESNINKSTICPCFKKKSLLINDSDKKDEMQFHSNVPCSCTQNTTFLCSTEVQSEYPSTEPT